MKVFSLLSLLEIWKISLYQGKANPFITCMALYALLWHAPYECGVVVYLVQGIPEPPADKRIAPHFFVPLITIFGAGVFQKVMDTALWTIESIGPVKQEQDKWTAEVIVKDNYNETFPCSYHQTVGGIKYFLDPPNAVIRVVNEERDIHEITSGACVMVAEYINKRPD